MAWLLLDWSAGEGGIPAALGNIVSRTAGADLAMISWAFALFLASQVFRALRWMLLGFRRNYRFSLSMAVTSIHVGLGHLLPFRLADVAFVGLFRHFGEVPVGHGTASVVLAKLLDLMAMGVVIGSAVAAGVGQLAFVAPVLVIVGFAGIIFLFPVLRILGRPARWILGKLVPGERTHWFDDMLEASELRGRKGRMTLAFLVSILVWVAKLSMFILLMEALGVTGVPEWKIFLASGITNIIMALPINGLLSIGTTEAGWTAAFAMVGVEGTLVSNLDIVEVGFSVHILWMLMAAFLMVLAVPLLAWDRRRRNIE
jgi:hypothetical protein